MIRKPAIVVLIAVIHFGLSISIVPIAMSVVAGDKFESPQLTLIFQVLVVVTKILHFPIISLSLYSRHWFPGDWIYVPIFFNSILWALAICLLIFICKRLPKRSEMN